MLATQRPEVTVIETGETVPATKPDQVAISGTLRSGATASIHVRGGHSRGVALLWEINGTQGDLQITADSGYINMVPLRLQGGRAAEKALSPIIVEDTYRWVPRGVPDGPPLHVAQVYAQLASDIREGTHLCATFDDAVICHRMLNAIHIANDSGTRQTYQTNT